MQIVEIKRALSDAAKKLFDADIEPELSRPDEQFGDYATNFALQLAKKTAKTPNEIARALVDELKGTPGVESISLAGPGFINFRLSDEVLADMALRATDLPKINEGQEILVEFGDPNPFKEMHIGHVYSYIIGDAIATLLETTGARVYRLSYHGDVGLHVAKTIWGMKKRGAIPDDSVEAIHGNSDIGECYQEGAKAYENDESAKKEIDKINEHVYRHDDEDINKYYDWGKKQSFEDFKVILEKLDIKIDKEFMESESADKGMELVKANLGKVFEESEGAIVYRGEKTGLHTRVFITSKGLPTYEAKDLGLAELKKDYASTEQSIIITAHEQKEYFKVMLAALKEFDPKTASITKHLYHGFVSLSTGKMSSRTGNVYRAADLLSNVSQEVKAMYPRSAEGVDLAAIKYGFLKHRVGSDIVYDIDESISLEGNSGPYLQYAHARASSILAKSKLQTSNSKLDNFDNAERSLARKVGEYPEIVEKAVNELMPHHICTYLYELAQAFNRFYETSRIIGDEREDVRLQLTKAYQQVLRNGLNLLNISAPERM